jgi:SagB-type dehydrogenase family enzyme
VEEALAERRSVRTYAGAPLSLEAVAQLLWAAQGITGSGGRRTAPSAGALYPLELYLAVGDVEGLAAGLYRYRPGAHELMLVKQEDVREALAEAALSQDWMQEGAIIIVITAVYERSMVKYGERGIRYTDMEAGHAAQNLYLQSEALEVGMVVVGAFHDEQVRSILALPEEETPLYLIPTGRKR